MCDAIRLENPCPSRWKGRRRPSERVHGERIEGASKPMALKRSTIWLDADEVAALDELAKRRWTTRSALIREGIKLVLASPDPTLLTSTNGIDSSLARRTSR